MWPTKPPKAAIGPMSHAIFFMGIVVYFIFLYFGEEAKKCFALALGET
jgi:hypothetical protein